jgi:tetratricopeptide (TPR) repeat protein
MRARRLINLLGAGLMTTIAPADDRSFDAQKTVGNALRKNPASPVAHRAYAQFVSENGNPRAAIIQWRWAQELEPDSATANASGGPYLQVGRAADSAAQFSRAIGLAGDNAAYHYNRANVEYMLRHELAAAWKIESSKLLRRALADFHAASRLAPNDIEYARSYAETFYGVPNPNWAEAEAAWKHVLALSSQADLAYLNLARVSLKRGDVDEARRCFEKVRDLRTEPLKRKLREQADRLWPPTSLHLQLE